MNAHATRNVRASECGFTLIEILVSLAIMAMVLTFAFQAYKGIQDAQQRVSSGIDRSRAAGVLLDRLERELVGSVLVQREDGADPLLQPYLFVASDVSLHLQGSDSVRFVSQTPTRMPGAETRRGLVMITYGLESEEVDVLHLVRKEEALPTQMSKDLDLGDGQIVAEELESFRMRFQTEDGAWHESWDSTGVSALDELPLAVEIAVKLWDHDDQGELIEGREQVRQFILPVRAVRLVAQDPNQEESECRSGTAVKACVAKFQVEIQILADELTRKDIDEALAEIEEPCWNAQPAPPALERLHELIERFAPDQAQEKCP